jgi:hypothetical protein
MRHGARRQPRSTSCSPSCSPRFHVRGGRRDKVGRRPRADQSRSCSPSRPGRGGQGVGGPLPCAGCPVVRGGRDAAEQLATCARRRLHHGCRAVSPSGLAPANRSSVGPPTRPAPSTAVPSRAPGASESAPRRPSGCWDREPTPSIARQDRGSSGRCRHVTFRHARPVRRYTSAALPWWPLPRPGFLGYETLEARMDVAGAGRQGGWSAPRAAEGAEGLAGPHRCDPSGGGGREDSAPSVTVPLPATAPQGDRSPCSSSRTAPWPLRIRHARSFTGGYAGVPARA